MNQNKCLVWLFLSVSLFSTACASRGRLDQGIGRGNPVPTPTVLLNEQGITTAQFQNADRPPILVQQQDLILERGDKQFEFDVTFILNIPTPAKREQLARLNLEDVSCERPPRCEVTFMVGSRDGDPVRVPKALIDLDSAVVTPFSVLISPLGQEQWSHVDKSLGFVTSNSKLLPDLEIPLDNTGIADWRFLNPRSPRALSGVLPAPGNQSAVPKQDTTGRITPAALERLATEVLTRLGQADRALADETVTAVGVLGDTAPNRCIEPADPGEPTSTTNIPLWASQANLWNIRVICKTAVEALDRIETAPAPHEKETLASVTRATIQGLESAAQILLTVQTSNLVDHRQSAEEAYRLIKNIASEHEDALAAIQGARNMGNAEQENLRRSLVNVAAASSVTEISSQAERASRITQEVQARIDRITLRQKRVRFSNRTLDRVFLVTLKLDKEALLRSVAPLSDAERAEGMKEPYQNEETLTLERIEQEYGNAIDLTAADKIVTLSFQIEPGLYVDLDVWLLSKAPKAIVPFEVDFFDQTDDPAYSLGYLALRDVNPQDTTAEPDNSFTTNLVVGFTGKDEPCFGEPKDCKVPLVDVVRPYVGDRKSHYEANGQLDLAQTLGNRANAKLSLLYEKTDFGNVKDEKVSASQYQVNVFGTNNMILTYGRFPFAQPSNQIAISETGEGFRINFQNLSLSYLLKRESDDETADDHDKDHDAFILFWRQPIPKSRFFRKLDLIGVHGEDRCKSFVGTRTGSGDCPADTTTGAALGFPHVYTTVGGELFFNVPFGKEPQDPRDRPRPLTGSLAAYYSEKDSRQSDKPDGRGRVFLLTLGRPFAFEPESSGSKKVKPVQVLTGLLGYGTGDDPDTAKDEGYLGENAVFTRDLIFLSAIAGASNTSVDNVPHGTVGRGLSNKLYAGVQYTDNRASLWDLFTKLLRIRDDDIVSRSTTLSVHYFHLNEPVFDDRDAGWEFDAEFRMEQPKNVKWRMVAGYFNPGDALGGIVQKEVWTFSAGVVVEPAKLTF